MDAATACALLEQAGIRVAPPDVRVEERYGRWAVWLPGYEPPGAIGSYLRTEVPAPGGGLIARDEPYVPHEGDLVLFGKYSGIDRKVDGEEVKILRESDILAKIVK